jgi:hypothetical protein
MEGLRRGAATADLVMSAIYQGKYPTPFERHIAKYDRDHPCWLANRAKEFMRMNEQFWLAGVQYGWDLAHRQAKKEKGKKK